MIMCSRCHKRMAVVFLTKIENGESKQEGLCIKCAKELGIKPIDDILAQTGLDEESIEKLGSEMEDFLDNPEMKSLVEGAADGSDEGRVPILDFKKLMNEGLFGGKKESSDVPAEKGKDETSKDSKKKKEKKKEYKYLGTYTQNLTDRARAGELDGIVGRDRELERVMQILCRRQKNNPCLIGEPGVGKTAIAEALAIRIAKGDVPFKLRDHDICLVDLTALVAGTQFRGQFESRVLGLLSEVKEKGNVILVIDEVHNIVGAGDAEGSMNAANILKPALSRGEIQVIGATTLTEYRKYIEKDSALERRFQPVTVNEPSVADTVEILRGIKGYYEKYHGVQIPDIIAESAARLSERYITDRYLPDKAIDLVDEAASHVSMYSPCINERHALAIRQRELIDERERLEAEAPADDGSEERYHRIANLRSEELRIEERLAVLDEECGRVTLSESDLADVIEIWTGIPASNISENDYEKLEQLENRIYKRIVGQAEAVSAVSRAVRRGRAGVSYKRKPVSFIFAGPTGVGKTELVKVLSEDLFSSPETLIRLDMSEFMDKFSVSRIIGAPPGYVGYDDAGQLTEKIRRRPYSVVLFDEIEKAHPDVLNILLQILDDGRITDARGKEVSFENTVIVMTTNAGSTNFTSPVGFAESAESTSKEKTMKALSEFLRPEFINRVDEVITFRSLSAENFKSIADIMLGDLRELLETKGIKFAWSDSARDLVAEKSYSVKYGARNMRRFIQTEIEDKIAERIIAMRGNVAAVSADAENGEIKVLAV